MQENRRKIGKEKEAVAAEFLRRHGFLVFEQNFSCRQGEIDLIAKEGETLVFVEVKYRKNECAGSPEEAVDLKKQRRIVHTARVYLHRHGLSEDICCRFDVVTITEKKIRLIRNAFLAE